MFRSSRLIRGARANPVIAPLNALIMPSKEVEPGQCFHIAIHIYIISLISAHADNIHGFHSNRSSRSRAVPLLCGGSLLQRVPCTSACAWVPACASLSVCPREASAPRGPLWCCRGNWMCDAHRKSPLALGKRSFNPSMPLWKAQPKGRLILSTGKHQMVPCSLHRSLRLSALP